MNDQEKKKSIQVDYETWKKLKYISAVEEVNIGEIVKSLSDTYFVKQKYKFERK